MIEFHSVWLTFFFNSFSPSNVECIKYKNIAKGALREGLSVVQRFRNFSRCLRKSPKPFQNGVSAVLYFSGFGAENAAPKACWYIDTATAQQYFFLRPRPSVLSKTGMLCKPRPPSLETPPPQLRRKYLRRFFSTKAKRRKKPAQTCKDPKFRPAQPGVAFYFV